MSQVTFRFFHPERKDFHSFWSPDKIQIILEKILKTAQEKKTYPGKNAKFYPRLFWTVLSLYFEYWFLQKLALFLGLFHGDFFIYEYPGIFLKFWNSGF